MGFVKWSASEILDIFDDKECNHFQNDSLEKDNSKCMSRRSCIKDTLDIIEEDSFDLTSKLAQKNDNCLPKMEKMHWSKVETQTQRHVATFSKPFSYEGTTALLMVTSARHFMVVVHGVNAEYCTFRSRNNSQKEGALQKQNCDSSRKIFIYSIEEQQWFLPLSWGDIPQDRTGHCAVLLPNRRMWAFGGKTSEGICIDDVHTWSFDNAKWERHCKSKNNVGVWPSPRYDACAIFISRLGKDGSVLLFGGISGTETKGDTWVWDVSAKTWSRIDAAGILPIPRYG